MRGGERERGCGRVLNMEHVELEFDEEMKRWYQLGAAMRSSLPDNTTTGPYAASKRYHQEAAERMALGLNALRRAKRAAASSGPSAGAGH